MKVNTRTQAWEAANEIFPTDYQKDETASANAGYDIYRHATLNPNCRICDLGNRLEVIVGNCDGIVPSVTNIWIEPEIVKDMGTQMSQNDYAKLCGDGNEWEMTVEKAKIYINEEFGFETSRIEIISEVKTYYKDGIRCKAYQTYSRTPQYCATDYNYVRFNVNNWYYEAINGQLHQYCC